MTDSSGSSGSEASRSHAAAAKTINAVVPSLRVDAVGAKGFKVSRSYFAKGVAGGKVSVNGKVAGKSTEINAGDEMVAEGLGRLRLVSVEGATKRGNLKVSLAVEKGAGSV